MNEDSSHERDPETSFEISPMSPSRNKKKVRRSVREESRAVYRQAIMEAAIQIFGRTGFRDTKIADIASEAGVATGTLYNYFSSKEDIFSSIIDDGRERLATEIELQTNIEDPLVRLRELVRVLFDFLEEHGALVTIYMQIGGHHMGVRTDCDGGDEPFREFLFAQFIAALTESGDRVRRDHSAQTLAMALGGLINGSIINWIEGGFAPGLRDQVEIIMDLFLNGATPR